MIFRINSNIIQKPYLVTKDKKNLSLFKDWFMLRPVYEIASAGLILRLLRNDGFTSSLRARLTGRAGRHDEAPDGYRDSNPVEKIASASFILRVLRNDEFQSPSPVERGWGEAAYFL